MTEGQIGNDIRQTVGDIRHKTGGGQGATSDRALATDKWLPGTGDRQLMTATCLLTNVGGYDYPGYYPCQSGVCQVFIFFCRWCDFLSKQ